MAECPFDLAGNNLMSLYLLAVLLLMAVMHERLLKKASA